MSKVGKGLSIADRPAVMSVRIGLVMTQIADEVDRQFSQWGTQDHPHGYAASPATAEWEDEVKAMVDSADVDGSLTWKDIIDEEIAEAINGGTDERVYEELVQVAACIVSCLENMSRNRKADIIKGTAKVTA